MLPAVKSQRFLLHISSCFSHLWKYSLIWLINSTDNIQKCGFFQNQTVPEARRTPPFSTEKSIPRRTSVLLSPETKAFLQILISRNISFPPCKTIIVHEHFSYNYKYSTFCLLLVYANLYLSYLFYPVMKRRELRIIPTDSYLHAARKLFC